MNKVQLSGMICKEPIYRVTPMGRKYADVLLAIMRMSGDWDYVPCIFWGGNAERAKDLEIGASVEVNGRLQSRIFEKKLENGETEKRIIHEVSVNSFQLADGEDGDIYG